MEIDHDPTPARDVPRRDVDLGIDASAVPRDWSNADPFATTLLDGLSLLFPEGERFFIDSVKQLRHHVTSAELARQVVGFIGQEAMHGREHRAFNRMLVEHGYAEAPAIEAGVGRFLGLMRRILSKRSQLAATCALEHFTALLAESLLSSERLRAEIDPSVRTLWVWHALEESEHKAVAFDVYTATGSGYARRAAIMLLTTAVFFAVVAVVHARLMWTRGILFRPWTWMRGIGRMWITPGYFRRLVPGYLAYFRPRFHPDDRDTEALLADWRERLFGETGELRRQAA
jgi:uncharacterized protein